MTTRSCRFFSVLLLAGVLAGVTGCDAVKSLFQGEPSPQERAQEAYARAEELMSQGQLEQAEAAYRAAYAADPKLGGAALGLALVYRNRGEEGRALLQLQQARMLLPDDPAPPALMGDVLMNQGRYQRAARSYETAMRLAEGDAELRRRFARALIRAGELEEAEYQVERLLRDEPGNPAFEALEGLLLAAEGETRRARNILEDAARSSVGPEAPAALGWFLLREGEPAGAIRALRQSVEKGGDFADRRLLAEALIESGDGAAAVEVTGTLTRERPLDPLAHAMHARALVASGDHDAALKAANEAIRLDPKLAPALLARGAAR